MTELPPPLPPTVARRGSLLGGWAAAVVIIASVATGIVQAWTDKQIVPAQGQSADFLKMEIEARYLVGMNEVAKPFAASSGFSQRQWLSPIEKAATSDQDLLRLAILEGEILGDAEAQKTLKRIGDRSPDVIEDRIALESVYQTGGGIDLTNEQEEKLRKRHGWVGRLAVVHRSAAGDPERRAVLSGAARTFVGTFALGTIVVIGLLAGIVLGAWGMFRFWSGSGHWGFAERERVLTLDAGSVWLETFAVYIGVMVLGGGAFPESWAPLPQVLTMFGAVVLGLLWPLVRGLSRAEFRAGFGWTRGGQWALEMAAGVIGYVAGLPILALGVAITLALTVSTGADASHPINHMAGGSPVTLVFIGLLAVLWAPFTEETFFRGAFFTAWRQRCGRWLSALATGLIFAAIHPQGWTAIPALGAIGLVLALIREWRGGLLASMTAHALNNGTLLVIMVFVMR
jgi:membrane protease YdiL (CAAX protease family)